MPRSLDVALATCTQMPETDPDRDVLLSALQQAGLSAAWYAWDDPEVDWSVARMTLPRSTWNYPQAYPEFLGWLERVASISRLENPLAVMRENLHKGYLLELGEQGIPVPPTELVRREEPDALEQILSRRGWEDVVIKPAVSAASWRTFRVGADNVEEGQKHLATILADSDALVQAYMVSVECHGEHAVVVIDGEPTHAVRKGARFGGADEQVSERGLPVAPADRALVRRVLEHFNEPLLYTRVDVAPGPDGNPVVMELELVEPSLYFTHSDQALERFVTGVLKRLAA